MNKKEFLAKYDNKKPYGWVCYTVQCFPPMVYTTVLAVGMTKEEAKENAKKKNGDSIDCKEANRLSPIRYEVVTEAAYRKLKTAKTLNKFPYIKCGDESILAYSED